MVQIINATFDGAVLRPDAPHSLQANTRVRITVATLPMKLERRKSFLRTARDLKLQGPADWFAKLDHYLYGDCDEPAA